MHVTFLGHAQLLVRVGAAHVLLDPWFAEPVFARSWWRYPPAPYPTAASLPKVDALLLSHIHPDHSGPGTLAQIPSTTPTWLLPFRSGALERRLARAKYSRVSKARPFEPEEILPGVRATFVAHDRGWEVSSIVLEADGVRLYHGNDNALSVAAYAEIVQRLGPIDIAFLPFAGASSFPTCFEWASQAALDERCRAKKVEGLRRFLDGVEGLRPRVAVPFASSWALFEDDQLSKNFADRPTPHEAVAAAKEAGHDRAITLEPGDEWTPEGPIAKRLTTGWTYDADSVRRYASSRRADIEAAAAERNVAAGHRPDAARLDRAFREYVVDMFAASRDSTRDLELVAGFVAEGDGGGRWHMRFRPGEEPQLEAGAGPNEDETLTVTAAELWDIVAGPANWEDPWYGYRLRVKKRPGAGYYRAFWEMLLNFDDEATSERLFEVINETELRATLARDLEDIEAWSLYSDYLQQRGDVRGELMAIDLALEKIRDPSRKPIEDRRAALMQEHGALLLGPTLSRVAADHYGTFVWRRGFVSQFGYVGDRAVRHPLAVGWLVDLLAREPDAFVFVRHLTFTWTDLEDLRPLTTYAHLTELDVSSTRVTDPGPLLDMPRLTRVNLQRCAIANTAVDKIRRARPELHIDR